MFQGDQPQVAGCLSSEGTSFASSWSRFVTFIISFTATRDFSRSHEATSAVVDGGGESSNRWVMIGFLNSRPTLSLDLT